VKAAVCDRPGGPEVIRVADVRIHTVRPDGVLVRVHAASVNTVDLFSLSPVRHVCRGVAAGGGPRPEVMGHDFAGRMAAVGDGVTRFRVGDEVFGDQARAFAQYVCVAEGAGIAGKPARASFAEAAAVPVAAPTALQAGRDHGRLL
jgi:NADPH:quinone reductase-like Zn-dependent oxidoreductase